MKKTRNYLILLVLSIVFLNINVVGAYTPDLFELNHKYTLYPGSGIHYIFNNWSSFEYIGVRDISWNIPNLKSRWVEFKIIKNGDEMRIERCYNFDYCQIGRLKVQVLNVFEGKEALATQIKIMKVYL